MSAPSVSVTHRRRAALWLVVMLVGFVLVIQTGSLFAPTADGAHLAACLLTVAATLGFAVEMERSW